MSTDSNSESSSLQKILKVKELAMALAAFGLDEVKFEKLLIRTSLRFEQIAQRFG